MEEDTTQMQAVEYQLRQMQQVIDTINNQLLDVNNTAEYLKSLEKLKGNEEVLFPLANGIFVKGQLSDNKIVKMNVGSNIVVEKTIKEAVDMMNSQAKEMENYRTEVELQVNSLLRSIEQK